MKRLCLGKLIFLQKTKIQTQTYLGIKKNLTRDSFFFFISKRGKIKKRSIKKQINTQWNCFKTFLKHFQQ